MADIDDPGWTPVTARLGASLLPAVAMRKARTIDDRLAGGARPTGRR